MKKDKLNKRYVIIVVRDKEKTESFMFPDFKKAQEFISETLDVYPNLDFIIGRSARKGVQRSRPKQKG